MPLPGRVLESSDLEELVMIIRTEDGRVVEFPNKIVPRSLDVEVEPPIYVMVVGHTYALISLEHAGETPSGPQRPIHVEPPLRYVSIPPSQHHRLQNDLLPLNVDCHAAEVTSVDVGIEDCLGWRTAQPESRR